ncbi:MAG: hypothetical protein R3Y24_04320 [Eubacteriales bacterium]
MDRLLEKMGLYDMLVLISTGFFIGSFSVIVYVRLGYEWIYASELSWGTEVLVIVVLSYFIGTIFQEVSSIIHERIYVKDDIPLHEVWNTLPERKEIEKYFKEEIPSAYGEDDIRKIYDYCRMTVMLTNKLGLTDKYQALSAMSRSLYLYFGVLVMVLAGFFVTETSWEHLAYLVISMIICWLFYKRYKRYFKLRYKYIYKAFYYDMMMQKQRGESL